MNKDRSIAIIGMDCRFPGAASVEAFWDNLRNGVESITRFTNDELAAAGVDPDLLHNPSYVPARSLLDDVDLFDAEFFGYSPKEADAMDPQQRVFLEAAWRALENAGYDGEKFSGAIGVFAGCYLDTYLLENLCANREFIEGLLNFKRVGAFQTFLGNDKDYLTSRVAYKLNLRGPAVTVQTACSTSLVAVCQACQSLLLGQCDVALAGGVTITFPQKKGYLYQEGGMLSPDGHCRAFDAAAQGTVFGSGVGIVVLKRFQDALADGDTIHAVIRGSALNNDGAVKVSYTAPSIDGQAEVIALAHALAGVPADTITYVEAHGTGTPLGDPIEIAGLTQAFRQSTAKKNFCAIGSVKTNIGHLDVAAGVAGLIKTVLALKHKMLPPSLHFTQPNPKIPFADSPFFVNTRLAEWKTEGAPRRAGVSSFGVGGTNAHLVLEEAPAAEPSGPSRPSQLLLLSAKTPSALETATRNLALHLTSPERHAPLADIAFTLQTGRHDFNHRCAIICRDANDAAALLRKADPKRVFTQTQERRDAPVVFMFPGQGAQYVQMSAELHRTKPAFRDVLDSCAEFLRPALGLDLRHILHPVPDQGPAAEEQLLQTRLTQPALFAVEYALAKLWISWGVKPAAMIGHSVGEYVAACIAGVFPLESALRLVAERARLVQARPPGAMIAVRLAEKDLAPLLDPQLAIAAVNAPNLCVVSGPLDAIDAFEKRLEQSGIAGRRLKTSHAFHSPMMEPVLGPLTELLRQTPLSPPRIPYVSNVTGQWITDAQATNPDYWASHVRQAVRFADGVAEFFNEPAYVLLEVGPGQALSTLARQHPGRSAEQVVLASLSSAKESEGQSMLTTLGRLWLAGVAVDWKGFYAHERRRRVPLPAYPFERRRHWVEPPARPTKGGRVAPRAPGTEENISIAEVSCTTGRARSDAPSLPAFPTGGDGRGKESRRAKILTQLRTILHDLSGIDLSNTEPDVTFLELGFDSLFLTQARQTLQNSFGVKVTFRQLMEDASSLAALAAHIDQQLPPEALSEQAAVEEKPAAVPSIARNGDVTSIERAVNQQLQAMSQLIAEQLAALRNGGAHPPDPQRQRAAAVPDAAAPVTPQTHGEQEPFGPYRPVQKGSDGGLTSKQRRWLDEFTARYTRRTAKSKSFAQEHRSALADPRSVAGFRAAWKELVYQIVVERAHGSRLWDIDGNEYIDVTMGFGVNLFGHSPQFVLDAATQQLQRGVQIGPQSPLAGEVAGLIREFTGTERVTFCNTGSEAVMAALRIARTVTGRSKIAFFAGDYHGMFDEVLLRPNNVDGKLRSLPIAPGIPSKVGEDVLILDYGPPESLETLRAHASELAAVLVEPVQSRHPDLQPKEFLHELRRLTEQSGTVLIFDEVITGFRVHPGGAQAVFGVRPDLATYGKVIGGGFPIGALAGEASCMDALDGGFWSFGDDSSPEEDMTFFAGTFVRHPLALAAARASLLHLKERGPALQEDLNQRTTDLAAKLNAHFDACGVPIRVMHFGSLFRFHYPAEWPFAPLLIWALLERGIYVREAHQNCFLSTAHSAADMERVVGAVKECVAELRESELLPQRGADSQSAVSRICNPPSAEDLRSETEAPLTEAQREVWLASQLGPEASCAYNESFTARLRGPLNVEALRRAFQEVVARHDALRTVISSTGDSQTFLPANKVRSDLALENLGARPAAEREARLKDIYQQEATTPFDLVRGPLFRVRLVKIDHELRVFIFTAHHIVCDGWSSGVVLSELARIYSALCNGRRTTLDPAEQFGEFACDQVRRLESPENDDDETWWLKQFDSPPPPLELPTDRSRPGSRVAPGAVLRAKIPAEAYRELKGTAAALGVTVFAMLLSGFNVLLHRLSRQDDLVVGTFASGQAMAGAKALVGHCVNMLPIRSGLGSDAGFAEYLRGLKTLLLDAHEHGNCTYGRLLQKLQLSRDSNRAPLVQAVFNLERKGDEGVSFQGLEVDVDQNPHGFVLFDLFLNIRESGDEPILDLEYNAALFDAATMQRWLDHYMVLLESIAANPQRRVHELPLLSEAERQQMLIEWNDTAMDFPTEQCIHELFATQVLRTPRATALVCGEERWSYEELNRRAESVAGRLRESGIGPEALVGVCMPRSPEMVAAILGVLKAGGAYVPLDPGYPQERLAFMMKDSRASLLLTTSLIRERLNIPNPEVLCVDDPVETAHPATQSSNPRSEIRNPKSSNLAYVIYTSGSTGQPKGVAIEHRSAVAFIHWAHSVFSREELAGVLASTSICFDLSVFEMFVPLSCGGAIILSDDALQLPALPARNEVTLINTVPSAMTELLRLGAVPSSVRTINLAGEPLSTQLVDELYRLPGLKKVYDLYGPTESTTYSTFTLRHAGEPPSIGRAVANTQVYILDEHLQPVPIGVPGELFIGGAGLARGYLHRAELTAEKFIANPFSKEPAGRLYRTGDLARYWADGNIEFLGRLDQQVKLRGFRIELVEIESALRQHPAVNEAAVVVREQPGGDKRLVAYVAPRVPAALNGHESEWLSGIVSQFETGYSAAIREGNGEAALDPTLNIYAWSGLEKTQEEVSEWIDQVAARILPFKPKRLLEIGCGTGLVLFRLAPHVEEYWATDLSQVALDNIEQRLRGSEELSGKVKLLCRLADNFDGLPSGRFDGVILNAVLEYFPGVEYLERVLEGAATLVAPGGFIFLGAVPNFALHEVFHACEQLDRASESDAAAAVRSRARRRVAEDQRLLVSPGFFRALPARLSSIRHVEIQTLGNRFANEASRLIADTYFDAVLRVGAARTVRQIEWHDWRAERLDAGQVSAWLDGNRTEPLGITNVPHAGIQRRLRAVELLKGGSQSAGEIRSALALSNADAGVEELLRLPAAADFVAHVTWSSDGSDALCDLVFQRRGSELVHAIAPEFPRERPPEIPSRPLTSNPLHAKLARALVPELRAWLQSKLPTYMVPSDFVVLEEMPRTANGKLDRRALPLADLAQARESFTPPRTPAETAVARIWGDLLGAERVGVDDDFFALGGHSLLVAQMVARIRDAFQVELPMRRVFERPTIAAIVPAIEELLVEQIQSLSEDDALRLAGSEAPVCLAAASKGSGKRF